MLDYVLLKLRDHKGHLPDVALGARVPYRSCLKILSRETPNPGVDTVQRLYDFFQHEEREALLSKLQKGKRRG